MTVRRLAFFLFLMFVWVRSADAADVRDHILSGTKFANEKKYKDAIREFETSLSIEPDNPDANLLLGLTLMNAGRLDEAVTPIEKAMALKPTYNGFHNLGVVHANRGHYDKAADAYTSALKLNPKSYQTWHQLGKANAMRLAFNEAIQAYTRAAELNPKFPDAHQGLASAHYWAGNLTAALEQVDKLNKLGFSDKAEELETWIKNKEAKKKKAAGKAAKTPKTSAPLPAPVPSNPQ